MPRDTLTREQIVLAAIEVLDEEGLEGLKLRQLGERLSSAATAVYWHVQSKDNLVILAGDHVWGEIDLPELDAENWRAAATSMAVDLHAMLDRHLWLVPAMGTHLIYGPGKARHDDHCLAVYETAGFTGAEADWAMNTVFVFVLGLALGSSAELAWKRRMLRGGDDGQKQMQEAMDRMTGIAMQFPRMRARMEAWGRDGYEAPEDRSFEFGIETIFDGLEARRQARVAQAG